MEFFALIKSIASGDWYADGANRAGRVTAAIAATGWFTTQNLTFLAGSAFTLGSIALQMWWEYYRQRRFFYLRSELEKARLRKQADMEGLDSKTIKAFQQSPDPDSGD